MNMKQKKNNNNPDKIPINCDIKPSNFSEINVKKEINICFVLFTETNIS